MKKVLSLLLLLSGVLLILSDFIDHDESRIANEYVLNLYKQNKSYNVSSLQYDDDKTLEVRLPMKENTTPFSQSIEEETLSTISKISIPSLELEYPIMKGNDNSYYLNHDPEGNINKYGSLFWDYKGRPLIFGHNIANGAMFGKLKQLKGGESVYINEIAYEVSGLNLVDTTKIMSIDTLSLITCHGDSDIRLVVSLNKVEE